MPETHTPGWRRENATADSKSKGSTYRVRTEYIRMDILFILDLLES